MHPYRDGWTAVKFLMHRTGGRRKNNRAENSHLPIRRRERKMMGFRSQASAKRFLSSHAAVYNAFNTQRHLTSRRTLKVFRTEQLSRELWPEAEEGSLHAHTR